MAEPEIVTTEDEQGSWTVEVRESGSSSTHTVKIPAGFGVPGATDEELVRESFRFLLERESKEQILGSFDLPMISRYFPEYHQELQERLGPG